MRRIYLDMDNTLTNSSETIINFMGYGENYKDKDLQWDFSPYLPKEEVRWALSLFTKPEFYGHLELYPNCYRVLSKLSEKYELIIITKKQPFGIEHCDMFLRWKLPFIHRVIYLSQDDFEKGFVGSEDDYMIDDKIECLRNFRGFKMQFGDFGYQNDEINEIGGLRVKDWETVEAMFELED